MRVHLITGSIAPMPPLVKVRGSGRILQGGLPPRAFRSSTAKWGNGNQQHSPIRNKKHINMRSYLEHYSAFMNAGRRAP